MTVVNPKSISGINSITTGSGSDDILTIHNNNGTERLRIDSTGTTKIVTGIVTTLTATGSAKVGTGVTLSSDGDVFATGVCTATSFSGDGSNLTGISGVSVANQADNRVITNTGTTDALNAEANLTFSGSELVADSSMITAQNTGAGSGASKIQLQPYGTDGYINCTASGNLYTRMGTGFTTRTQIDSSGNFTVSSGNLVIGTSGKGIDFSATSDGSGTSSSELLDDYEEGTWTPTLSYSGSGSATLSEAYGHYTKIGRMIHVIITMAVSAKGSGSGNVNIGGLPYQTGSTDGFRLNGTLTYVAGFNDLNSQVNVYRAGAGSYMEVFHMNSINPTSAITSVNINNVTNSTTIRGHAIYYVS